MSFLYHAAVLLFIHKVIPEDGLNWHNVCFSLAKTKRTRGLFFLFSPMFLFTVENQINYNQKPHLLFNISALEHSCHPLPLSSKRLRTPICGQIKGVSQTTGIDKRKK